MKNTRIDRVRNTTIWTILKYVPTDEEKSVEDSEYLTFKVPGLFSFLLRFTVSDQVLLGSQFWVLPKGKKQNYKCDFIVSFQTSILCDFSLTLSFKWMSNFTQIRTFFGLGPTTLTDVSKVMFTNTVIHSLLTLSSLW